MDGLTPLGCDRCSVLHLAPPSWEGDPCAACGEGTMEEAEPADHVGEPELVVPFTLSKDELKGALEPFVKGVPFRARGLDPATLAERAVRVWWPLWLTDVDVAGRWEAEAGFEYETQSYREILRGGKWRSEPVTDTRVRWEPRVGQVSRRYTNVPARALEDERQITSLVGPPDRRGGVPFSEEYNAKLAATAVRLPDREPEEAWPEAEAMLRRMVGEDCRQASGAPHLREFSLKADYKGKHHTWLLQPMYATWYQHAGDRHLILVHGQSGKAGGPLFSSTARALACSGVLVVSALVILGGALGMALFGGAVFAGVFPEALPLLVPLTMLGIGFAVLVGLLAFWPVIRAALWNRRQRSALASDG